MKLAIDLTWVKPKCNGGIESYIRNLLDGFTAREDLMEFVLVCARDNAETFEHYLEDTRFTMEICPISAFKVGKRILWHNLNFNKTLRKLGIENCFMPVYCKPLKKCKSIRYVTTIHDLQQLHFPEYFSLKRRLWMKFAWKRTVKTSDCVIAISQWVKNDIATNFGSKDTDIRVILNPIVVDHEKSSYEDIVSRFGIEDDKYYFCLSSMLKHKNIITAIKTVEKIVEAKLPFPNKLVITGITEADENRIVKYIEEHNLKDYCVLTGFVSNEDRNALFAHSYAFLFPSVFEGFGMPVVEGLMLGSRVITTKCTSIPEVSEDKAVYVDDPYDVEEWIRKIKEVANIKREIHTFPQYEKSYVAGKYLEVFKDIFKE